MYSIIRYAKYGLNWLFTITWGCFSRRGRLSAGAEANTMFVMKVMPHGRGVYHLPQASSSFVPHDCGVLRLALFPLESASRFKQLLYVNPSLR